MNLKTFDKGEVLFRQGDPRDGMYYIHYGKVGVFNGYETENEVKIEELYSDQFVGEMGLIAGEPRSATVVSLMDGTQVEYLTEEDFKAFFLKNPVRVYQLMQQMSHRLRRTTRKYTEACHEAYDLVEKQAQASAGEAT